MEKWCRRPCSGVKLGVTGKKKLTDYNVHLTKAYGLHTKCLYPSVPCVLSSNVRPTSFPNFSNFKPKQTVQLRVWHPIAEPRTQAFHLCGSGDFHANEKAWV